MINYIAYYRVSTKGQEESGLGLQAQKEAVRRYVGSDMLIFEFEEIESGRRKTRPESVSYTHLTLPTIYSV